MANAQNTLYISANGRTRTATLESNASVEALKQLLPLTIRMSDYGGWEKVGDLPRSITRNDRQTTAQPGDIMLYQGNSIVIFYGENAWAYTPLGKLDGLTSTEIKDFLDGNSLEVTFSLSPTSGIKDETPDKNPNRHVIYDMNGRIIDLNDGNISDLPQGIYIIDGVKTRIN